MNKRLFILVNLYRTCTVAIGNAQEPSDSLVAQPGATSSWKVSARMFRFAEKYFVTIREKAISDDKEIVEPQAPGEERSEWHTVKYRTFQLVYIQHENGARSLIELSTNSKGFKLPFGLKLGESREQIIRQLGQPSAASSSMIVYSQEFGDGVSADVELLFEKGFLTDVDWKNFPLD